VNIETQLGYTYAPSKPTVPLLKAPSGTSVPVVHVSGIDRNAIAGSFLVSTWITDPKLVGAKAILSPWNAKKCANCQNHTTVRSFVQLHGYTHEQAKSLKIEAKLHTRRQGKGFKNVPLKKELKIELGKHVHL
jgi:hypothetical protein